MTQLPDDKGAYEIWVDQHRFRHMDGVLLLQLMTSPRLRALSSLIALRKISLDPSAVNSALVTRVWYALLPETAAEHSASTSYSRIFQTLKKVEPSFAQISHSGENIAPEVAVLLPQSAAHPGTNGFEVSTIKRVFRVAIRPFAYIHLAPLLARSFFLPACPVLHLSCELHRIWADLLSIDLEHLLLHTFESLQIALTNTATLAQRCCRSNSSDPWSLSRLFMESAKFFSVQMSLRCTTPVVTLVAAREIVSSLLYSAMFLASLHSLLFLYFDTTNFTIFSHISSSMFYLGASGCFLLLVTRLIRILVHRSITLPFLHGHTIFSLLHDALLLRQTHRTLHPMLLSSEADHESDANIVAALATQTPVCTATSLLSHPNASITPQEQQAFNNLGAAVAASARQSLQHGIFPAISLNSAGAATSSGASMSNIMQGKLFLHVMQRGRLEPDAIAVDWWCGFSISGKRFSILHQLGLAPTVRIVYVSDDHSPASCGQTVSLTPHLPLHDSGPIGMSVLLLHCARCCLSDRLQVHGDV
jgi:hypothetical protein